jgi:hypothetical protein
MRSKSGNVRAILATMTVIWVQLLEARPTMLILILAPKVRQERAAFWILPPMFPTSHRWAVLAVTCGIRVCH